MSKLTIAVMARFHLYCFDVNFFFFFLKLIIDELQTQSATD